MSPFDFLNPTDATVGITALKVLLDVAFRPKDDEEEE